MDLNKDANKKWKIVLLLQAKKSVLEKQLK